MVKTWVSTEAHYSSKAIFRIESLLFYHLFCWFELRLNVTIIILSVWMGRNTALDDCSALQENNLRVHIFLCCKNLKFSSDFFIFFLFVLKNRLWVHVRTASLAEAVLTRIYNLCFGAKI